MKSLKLKTVKMNSGEKEIDFKYSFFITNIINFPGERGYNVDEMFKRLRISDALKNAKMI